jgi:hypothetical protein
MTKYDTHDKALAAVQQDGYALRYVTDPVLRTQIAKHVTDKETP